MLLYNILIGGIEIVGIDMPNCMHMPFQIKTMCVK